MLAASEKSLRWWGIDLRARWRRRVAVIGTYLIFIPLIAVLGIDSWAAHPLLAFFAMVIVTMIWRLVSVFRANGVVKSFDDPPLFGGKMRVNGLDEWARYRFGVENFDAASEAQQADLLARYRFGTFLVPAKPNSGWGLDERERGERDSAERWALKQMGMYLAINAGSWAVRHRPIDPLEVGGQFWAFALLAMTLPQARVLWTEPDPREASGEMELIQRQEA